jgi:hypothetical protein
VAVMRFNLADTAEEQFLAYYRSLTRLDRSVSLVDTVEEAAPGMYLVPSQKAPGVLYTVDLRAKTCTCADWTFRGSVSGIACKHIMAAHLACHRKPPVEVNEE